MPTVFLPDHVLLVDEMYHKADVEVKFRLDRGGIIITGGAFEMEGKTEPLYRLTQATLDEIAEAAVAKYYKS